MSYKVLIVDDSKLARMAIAKALSALHPDWTRLEAKDADEAIALVTNSTSVDIALLDFNMPKRDGLALAAELHRLKPQMPLAVVSANHQEEVVRRAHDVGADFLPKPVTERALAAFLDGAALRLEKAAR
jgi:CheY-like chemotaxis protein